MSQQSCRLFNGRPSSIAKTFTVPILTNSVVESNVTVNLALSNPTNHASAIGVQSTATLTIMEPPIDAWKLDYFGANANNPALNGSDGTAWSLQ